MTPAKKTTTTSRRLQATPTDMKQVTETRLAAFRNGFSVIPNVDKRCLRAGWPKLVVDEAEIKRWARIKAYEATGIRLENGLAVIDLDVDIENFADLSNYLLNKFPDLGDALFRTGAGNKEAWYVRTDEPFSRIASPLFVGDDPENGLRVEIFGGGSSRQFGSLGWHTKDELEYAWYEGQSPATVPLADLPLIPKNDMFAIVDAVTAWLRAQDYKHLTDAGSGEIDPEVVYDLLPDMIFETQHDGPLDLAELRNLGSGNCSASFVSGDIARNVRRCLVGVADGGVTVWDSMTGTTHMEASAAPVDTGRLAQAIGSAMANRGISLPPANVPRTTGTSWRQAYMLTADGAIRQNEANLAIYLDDAEWSGVIQRSAFDQGTWIMRALPDDPRRASCPRPMEDDDLSYMLHCAQHDMFPGVGPVKIRTAVGLVAVQNSYHPVRDYLDGIAWDAVERLNGFAAAYFGNDENSPYTRAAVRKWMISAVARIYQPGCKADHMLVLQGEQGIGKSSALSILADSWFGDDMPPVSTKDAKEWLRGKWIAEIAELSSITGRDIEHVKAFLTTQTDRFRKAYGYVVETVPRQTVFAGTTNDDEYLLDMTGGRRFWPIKVAAVDMVALRRDRDQLWAEAVVAYRAGEVWYLDIHSEAGAGAAQAQEIARSPFMEEEPVRKWLCGQKDDAELLSFDVATGALNVDRAHMPGTLQHRIPRILSTLGWKKTRRTRDGAVWQRGPNAEPYAPPSYGFKTAAEKAAEKGLSVVENGAGTSGKNADV